MEELKRIIFSKNFLILFIILFFINFIFYGKNQFTVKQEEKFWGEDFDYTRMRKEYSWHYKKLLQTCFSMDERQQEEYLKEYRAQIPAGPENAANYNASQLLLNQVKYIQESKNRYASIKENAEQMLQSSLFADKSSYAAKNIIKTAKDYEKTSSLNLKLFNEEWLNSWIERKETNIFILIVVFYTVLQFFSERKNGLWQMIHSLKRGRFELALTRLGILMLISVISVVIFYGSLWLLASVIYGKAGLSVLLQSSSQFSDCVFPMTVLKFLFIICFNKIFAAFVCGLILWAFLQLFSKPNIAMGVMGLSCAVEYICYTQISDLSNLKVLKYCNFVPLFDIENLYRKYLNINVVGTPVHIITFLYIFLGIFVLLLPVIVLLFSTKVYREKRIISFGKLKNIKKWCWKGMRHTSLLVHEGYKVLIPLFGIWILLFALLSAWSLLDYSKVYFNGTDTYKNLYYREIQGMTGNEADRYIEEKFEEIQKMQEGANAAQNAAIEYMQEAVEELSSQKKYLNDLYKSKGIKGDFVNPLGYKLLIGESGKKTVTEHRILQLFLLCLLFGGYMAYERQNTMISLMHSTKRTIQRVKWIKFFWMFLASTFLSILFFMIEVDNISGRIGLANLSSPVQSLVWMKDFPLKISLRQYLFLLGGFRIFLLSVACLVILWISDKCKNVRNGILVSLAVIVLPAVFVYIFL